ncbi:MAG: hypothetical protein LIO40_06030, partial [Ruminococcus sp.]|nr:hypothetical protein [Ruminococcus sp.]
KVLTIFETLICISLMLIIADCLLQLKDIAIDRINHRHEQRIKTYRVKAYEQSAQHRTSDIEQARALAISYVIRSEISNKNKEKSI